MSGEMLSTKAGVLEDPDGPFVVEQLLLGGLGPWDIVVRVAATGVCHTDQSPRRNPHLVKFPVILGHEGAGIVEQVGSSVRAFTVGDRVLASFDRCGRCKACLEARPAACEEFFSRNLTSERPDSGVWYENTDGTVISTGWFGQSSFSELAVMSERNLIRLDDDVPFHVAAPMACGFQTGAGSVINSFGLRPGDSLAVIGVGSVGMAAVMAARAMNAGRVEALDRHPDRLELAAEFGADAVHSTSETDQDEWAAERAFDFILDTTGDPSLIASSLRALTTSGVLGMVGLPGGTLSIDQRSLTSGRTLRYIVEGNAVPQVFVPTLIDLWRSGRFPVDRLIRTFPLSHINGAEQASTTGEVVKPVISMGIEP